MKHLVNHESVKIETMLLDKCRAIAKEEDRSLASVLRAAIGQFLEARKNGGKK